MVSTELTSPKRGCASISSKDDACALMAFGRLFIRKLVHILYEIADAGPIARGDVLVARNRCLKPPRMSNDRSINSTK